MRLTISICQALVAKTSCVACSLLLDRRESLTDSIACVVVSILLMSVFGEILQDEIFGARYRGVLPATIRGALGAMIGYGFYRLIFKARNSN